MSLTAEEITACVPQTLHSLVWEGLDSSAATTALPFTFGWLRMERGRSAEFLGEEFLPVPFSPFLGVTLSRGSQPLVLCTSCSRVFRFPVNPSTLPPVPGDILELPLAGSAPAPPATRESKRQKEEFLDREVFGSQAEMCKQSVPWFPEWWKRLW